MSVSRTVMDGISVSSCKTYADDRRHSAALLYDRLYGNAGKTKETQAG